MSNLREAITLIGGVTRTAEALDITPGAVSQWKRAPAHHTIPLEKATDGKITRHDLRPDLYPEEI